MTKKPYHVCGIGMLALLLLPQSPSPFDAPTMRWVVREWIPGTCDSDQYVAERCWSFEIEGRIPGPRTDASPPGVFTDGDDEAKVYGIYI